MVLDIAYLVSIVYGIYKGVNGGLIASLFTILRHVFAIILAMKLSYVASYTLADRVNADPAYIPLIFFLLGYFLITWILDIISKSASSELKIKADGPVSQGVGVVFWLGVLSLFFSAIISGVEKTDLVHPTFFATSTIYPFISDLYPIFICKMGYIMPALKGIFDSFQQMFADLAGVAKGNCCN